MGPLHIAAKIRDQLPLQQLQVLRPGSRRQTVFQLGRDLLQTAPPAFGQVVLHLLEQAHHALSDVLRGGKVTVPPGKLQHGPAGVLPRQGVVRLAQQGKERTGKPVASVYLLHEELLEALGVQSEHLHQPGDLLGNAGWIPGVCTMPRSSTMVLRSTCGSSGVSRRRWRNV